MTVIFKDLIIEKLNSAFKFAKENRIIVKFTSFALVAVLSIVVSIVACGITLGFNVNYSGKNIAVIRKTDVFDKAKQLVLENVEDKKTADAIEKPEFALTVTILDNLDDEDKVADAIVENTDKLSVGYAVKVNGEALTYTDFKDVEKYLEEVRCRYYVDGAENNAVFIDEVKVESGYYLNAKVENEQAAKAKIDTLQVKTISHVTSDIEAPYTIKYVKNNNEYVGYSKIVTAGVKGITRKIEAVETVNGAEISRSEISSEVIKEPVTQVVEKGTKSAYSAGTHKANTTSSGFIYPMNKGDVKKITSYWGDGRGHKGIDISADVGKPIFASRAGTVTEAGYDKAYGYYVMVDHGDGFKTRYAHCSSLCVKSGDKVSQGQQIAKIGNTGRSTGPHLHFEIYKSGVRVNPSRYINF